MYRSTFEGQWSAKDEESWKVDFDLTEKQVGG
jgi:hypothetical protein